MANILCVLYDDPVDGYPPQYPLDEVPKIESYFDGSSTPTPEGLDFLRRPARLRLGRVGAPQLPRGGG